MKDGEPMVCSDGSTGTVTDFSKFGYTAWDNTSLTVNGTPLAITPTA